MLRVLLQGVLGKHTTVWGCILRVQHREMKLGIWEGGDARDACWYLELLVWSPALAAQAVAWGMSCGLEPS